MLVLKIVLITIGSYLLLCIILYFIQDLFLFHPERLPQNFKFHFKVPFEEVFIDLEDGTHLNGLLLQQENSKGVIYYFKGNTRSIKGWSKFSRDFMPRGYDFFIMDYPGFGKSRGKRTEESIAWDSQAAYNWLKEHYPEEKIIIYGRSLGAGFATRIASWNNPAMLILDSPYYSFYRLAQRYTLIAPAKLLLKYHIPLYQYLQQVKCPVHIIHGDRDRLIPYRYSPELVRISEGNVILHTIKGAHHNNLPKFEDYHSALEKILGTKTND